MDPAIESVSLRLPQSWNRYPYALNSPVILTDPTGETVDLSRLEDNQRIALINALNTFTGNTYGVNERGELRLVAVGQGSSRTATDYLNGLIDPSSKTYYAVETTGTNRHNPDTGNIELNFDQAETTEYGKVSPATFNLGSAFIHELYHATSGLKDTLDGSFPGIVSTEPNWTGPVVDFVNRIRSERGLPIRAAYPGRPASKHRERLFFSHVNPRRPGKIYPILRKRP